MKVLLITGTCASGKTTLGYLLKEKYDFIHIDGDAVWKSLKKQGKKIGWNEIHKDLLKASINQQTTQNVVITHVVLPENLNTFRQFYDQLQINFKTVVISAKRDVLYHRNEQRTCWKKPTPKKYIDKFDELICSASNHTMYIDSTSMNPQETVEQLISKLGWEIAHQ